ncbi:MAG: hypothetical protein JKY65_06565 [Planctomycetes bacterium]|nr:hypothetical protein [Planctomycetota bacterium]
MMVQPAVSDRRLRGEALLPGVGFLGLFETGWSLARVMDLHGRPDYLGPDGDQAFFSYEFSEWLVRITTSVDDEVGVPCVESFVLSGPGAPPTVEGVRIGHSCADVLRTYGEAEREEFGPGCVSLTFPHLGIFFHVKEGKVALYGVWRERSDVPVWLRKSVRPNQRVVTTPGLATPDWVEGQVGEAHPLLPGAIPIDPSVPPAPHLRRFGLGLLSIKAPSGWRAQKRNQPLCARWRAPEGEDVVEVRVLDLPEAGLNAVRFGLSLKHGQASRLPALGDLVPDDLCDRWMAEDAIVYESQRALPPQGDADLSLRCYVLLVSRGEYMIQVEVRRTVLSSETSPDGEALARGVMRSLRFK